MTMTGEHATVQAARAAVIDKVRKLLAQAEDPAATPEEAQAFTAKAQQLMTKYAIDLAMITDADQVGRVTQRGWLIRGPYAGKKVSLVNAVSRANDCRAIYSDLSGGHCHIDVVGYPDDVEWVETLSRSLELQLAAALADAVRRKPPQVHGRTFAVGFVEGFVTEVSRRLQQARRDAIAAADAARAAAAAQPGRPGEAGATRAAGTAALVLVAKAARVEEEYQVRFPNARVVKRYTRLQSWSGYEPGRAAGSRANLARGAVGGRRGLRR